MGRQWREVDSVSLWQIQGIDSLGIKNVSDLSSAVWKIYEIISRFIDLFEKFFQAIWNIMITQESKRPRWKAFSIFKMSMFISNVRNQSWRNDFWYLQDKNRNMKFLTFLITSWRMAPRRYIAVHSLKLNIETLNFLVSTWPCTKLVEIRKNILQHCIEPSFKILNMTV